MRWFTSAWQQGKITDSEQDAVVAEYVAHVDRIKAALPPALRHVGGISGRFSLHDAWFIHSFWSTNLTKDLVVDFAGWYRDQPLLHVRTVYREAQLLSPTQEVFDQLRRSTSTEIVAEEVDLAEGGGFEHRLLLWPTEAGYFAVKFADIEVAVVHFEGGKAEILNLD